MISVCIATYNGEKFIISQLQSILSQLGPDDEVLVSDDGSKDNTISLIRQLSDSRIKILDLPQTLYDLKQTKFGVIPRVSRNFFNAILQAKGDTIYLSDQDDIWDIKKIQICEHELLSAEMVIHRRTDVDTDLIPFINNGKINKRRVNIKSAFYRPPFQGACMGFTRRIQEILSKNYPLIPISQLSHDHLLGFVTWILLGKDKIHFIEENLILYRRHGNNVSSTSEKSKNSVYFKIKYRIEVCRILFKLLKIRYTKKSVTCCHV